MCRSTQRWNVTGEYVHNEVSLPVKAVTVLRTDSFLKSPYICGWTGPRL